MEDLQNLLERIQREGVEQAEAQAEQIIATARETAQQLLASAEHDAAELRAAAQRDAEVFTERATTAIEHAVRDYVLRVQRSLEALFMESVRGRIADTLTPELMAEVLVKLADAYARPGEDDTTVEIHLAPADRDRFVTLFLEHYRSLIARGVEIHGDQRVRKGFRVSFSNDRVYHDFTLEAIAESLASILKPPLREIFQRAADAER